MLAIARLRDNPAPTPAWFRRVCGQLFEQQAQASLFDAPLFGGPIIQNAKPHPEAELVSFGADYVVPSRDYSPQALEAIAQAVVVDLSQYTNTHIPANWFIMTSDYDGSGYLKCEDYMPCIPGGYESFRDLVHQKASETNFYQAATLTPPAPPLNSEGQGDGGLA